VTGLLPEAVRHAVEQRSLFDASASFGVVTLVVALVLFLEWYALAVTTSTSRRTVLRAVVPPLVVAVGVTTIARMLSFL
jgi:hypothetical protein